MNLLCGAEFLNNKNRFPSETPTVGTEKCVSLDGDGDRAIYFRRAAKGPIVINGDKQFCFLMMYIVEKLEVLGLKDSVPHCLVNTAYTNS